MNSLSRFKIQPILSLLLIVFSLYICAPVMAQQHADTTLQLRAKEGLKFDVVRFALKPGTKVKLVFINDDDMDHNMVIVQPGTREKVIQDALGLGENGPSLYYVPKTKDVLWATKVLSPHQEAVYYFTVPEKSGIYPFVCTYPGHGLSMYGAIYAGIAMPPLNNDPNIPPAQRGKGSASNHAHHQAPTAFHPYTLEAPYLYRIFMPYSGPASIAVRLTDDISYCFDAELCRIRYAWSGGFLSNIDLWKNKKDTCAILEGEIFYQDNKKFPLEIEGIDDSQLQFKGYRLVDGGYPEFNYTLNGISIKELTKPLPEIKGFATTYKLQNYNKPIKIPIRPDYRISSKQGKVKGSYLVIPAKKTHEFTIQTIIK
jgi:plastocyanin